MWCSTRSSETSKRRAPVLILLCALAAGCAVRAASPNEAAQSGATVTAGPALMENARLIGTGRLSWFGLPIYVATLYAAPGFSPASPFDAAFVLELRYARAIDAAAIARTSREEMRRLDVADASALVRWHDELRQLLPDVRAGTRIAGLFRPGEPTEFYVDGRWVGRIDDPRFGPAFFSIWLDERTRAPRLRESLMNAMQGTLARASDVQSFARSELP